MHNYKFYLDEIKLAIPFNQKNRISINSGTKKVDKINGIECLNEAFIPKDDWRRLSSHEWNSLRAKKTIRTPVVCLNKLDLITHYQFYLSRIHLAQNKGEADIIYSSKTFKRAAIRLTQKLEKKFKCFGKSEMHHIYLGEPKLTTTTFNPRLNYYIGLHLDSFESEKSNTRIDAKNRICLNLSQESRFLFIVPISFNKLKSLVGVHNYDYEINSCELISNFFNKYPDYPVLRMKIEPFEYYTAPTEELIHDGSTVNNEKPDINLAIRGFFVL